MEIQIGCNKIQTDSSKLKLPDRGHLSGLEPVIGLQPLLRVWCRSGCNSMRFNLACLRVAFNQMKPSRFLLNEIICFGQARNLTPRFPLVVAVCN